MGQCVAFFTKTRSKVSPQIDKQNTDSSAPVRCDSPDRKASPSDSFLAWAKSLDSALDCDSISSFASSLSASTHWIVPSPLHGRPIESCSKSQTTVGKATADRPTTSKRGAASARTYTLASNPGRKYSDERKGSGCPSNQDHCSRKSNNSRCKSKTSEASSFWDDIIFSDDASWSSYSEESSDSEHESRTSSGRATGSSRPPISPLFIEDLEDVDMDESLGRESGSGTPVELAPGEEGPGQLAVVGVPCKLHTKGTSPDTSLSGIFSEEESKQGPKETNAQKKLDAAGSKPAHHVKAEGKSTSKTAVNASFSSVVYSDEQFRLMAESLGLAEPAMTTGDKSTGKTAGNASFSGVVYSDEEVRLMEEILGQY